MSTLTGMVQLQALKDGVRTLRDVVDAVPPRTGVEDQVPPDGVVPADIVRFLARLRLLEGVPFDYLVPDAELLPAETIRFFYLDRNWTDALVMGALSVGTVTSADRAQLAALYPIVRDEVDRAERLVRMKAADAPAVDATGRPIGAGGPITGFVLRSRIVSGWPGLHVRAYATDSRPDDQTIPDMDTSADRVRLLRMERLAPPVLLVLFDGVPRVVHIEEPRAGIQFGVRLDAGANPTQQTAVLPLRDVANPNAGFLKDSSGRERTVRVPFRAGSPGVVNVKALNASLASAPGTNVSSGGGVDSVDFAIEMLRFPIRQVFGDTSITPDSDAFRVRISMVDLARRFALADHVLGEH